MNRDEESKINSVIKENLTNLLTKKSLSKNEIKRIKERIRQRLKDPKFSIKTSKLAEQLIIYLINTNIIQSQDDLDKFINKSGFLQKFCVIKDFLNYGDKILTDREVDPDLLEMVDLKSIGTAHEDLKKFQLLQDIIDEETNKKVEAERQKLEKYKTCIDEGFERSEEEILLEIEDMREFPYLERDLEWFKELGLKSDPFPSREGLEYINQNLYDVIVTQTPIYKKYLRILKSDTKVLLNRSIIIYGEWGCGKTTFFEYFGYKCLQKNFFPIQILLNAEGSLQKLKDAFRNELFRKMADYITQVSSNDPRAYLLKRDDDEINLLFNMIMNQYNKIGFFIFLDGLHKSQDNQNIPLRFLNELQNILGIFKRRDIKISIFIAGSNNWKQNISYSTIFSGSIYQDEKIPGINENHAYDMLIKRLTAFSDKSGENFLDYKDIQRLFNTIRRSRATEIPFRILIQEFLSRGFVSDNTIKFDLRLERDTLQAISEILEEDKNTYKLLQDLAEKCKKDIAKFIKIQNVISHIYEKRKIIGEDKFLLQNKAIFQLLLKKGIIKKFEDKKSKSIGFWIEKNLHEIFLKIEKRVKFSPRYYLDKIFFKTQPEIKESIEHDKNLETLERWIFTNPQYEDELKEISQEILDIQHPLIEKIERNFFEITKKDLEIMDKTIIRVLNFEYKLSEEPYSIRKDQDLYDIFKYSWLDNQELIVFLNARDNFKERIKPDKDQNQNFLKIYKDAYDAQISRIGKYFNYNNVLRIGTNELTDYEKRILNQARAIYEESLFKKSVDRFFDLMENKCRDWLFNVMELIFNSKWKEHIPYKLKEEINKRKSSDKVKYGTSIQNDNELFYLSRNKYSFIFFNTKLWNKYFSKILGTDNKEILKKLEQITQIAHKVKHNLKDEDLKEFAPNIKEGLENTRNILKILNRGYRNLLDPNNILLKDFKVFMCCTSEMDLTSISPYILKKEQIEKVLTILKEYSEKEIPLRGNYIDIGDRAKIQQVFSCYYREFLAVICYLAKTNKIKIIDYEGSSLLFEF